MKNFYITGILLIILGIITFFHPVEELLTVGLLIGVGSIISAVNNFTGFYYFRFNRFLALGIIDFIIGVLMIWQPGITAFLIPFMIGLWLFSAGMTKICTSFWLGGSKIHGWWLMLINGIALVISSLVVCVSPLLSSISIMMLLAVIFIIIGVLIIFEGRIMSE
ncbi:MAG: DUF308 domain-containing protein [Synergistaceae bacterium]|nr:DUF308 domain-containing protein [Synergistaceae bacterium]